MSFGSRNREISRARTYSKRHNCTIEVRYCAKGRGKGLYSTVHEGDYLSEFPNNTYETVATYKNGKRI